MNANEHQVAGDHYKKYGNFQVWDLWWTASLDAFEANIIKYVMRVKGDAAKRLEDLDKAEHYLQKYSELLTAQLNTRDEQMTGADKGSWKLTDQQFAIVNLIAIEPLEAKLRQLENVASLMAEYRKQLLAEQAEGKGNE